MAEWIRIEKPDEHFQCSECGMKEALDSIELALGRGGDQAVINQNGEYEFESEKHSDLL